MIKKIFHQIFENENGVGLIEVMLAAAIVGGGAMLTMHLANQNKNTILEADVDKDIALVSNEIFSLLVDPPSCNANFVGKPTGTNINQNQISKCIIGNCRTTGFPSGIVSAFLVSTSNNKNINKVSNYANINEIRYSVNRMNGITFSTLFLDVKFKKSLPTTRERRERFGVQVVVDNNIIIGCPKAWNSILPY